MQRASVSTTPCSTALGAPPSIADDGAHSGDLTNSEERVGELRHDLSERHEAWLIDNYLEAPR
jgi:hypothetical protein